VNGTKAACVAAIAIMGCVGGWVIMTDESHTPEPAPATVAPLPGSVASIRVPASVIARVYPDMTIPPCATEDSHDCYWDAATMGNGHGRSFVAIGGHVYYPEGK
jgi:hypothetical protein